MSDMFTRIGLRDGKHGWWSAVGCLSLQPIITPDIRDIRHNAAFSSVRSLGIPWCVGAIRHRKEQRIWILDLVYSPLWTEVKQKNTEAALHLRHKCWCVVLLTCAWYYFWFVMGYLPPVYYQQLSKLSSAVRSYASIILILLELHPLVR